MQEGTAEVGYQITEEKNKYAPSYMIDAATVKKATDKASADTNLSTETETIDMGEDDAVTFTNEYLGQFTIPDAGSNTHGTFDRCDTLRIVDWIC